jgi:hypothetical protein
MRQAAQSQSGGNPQQADGQQEQAEDELERMNQSLEQMQQEAQQKAEEEAGFQLQQALEAMLAEEKRVKKRTSKLDEDRRRDEDDDLSRLQRDHLRGISEQQGRLVRRVVKALEQLKPQPVYAYGLGMVRSDFEESQSLLDLQVTDDEVQSVQQRAIEQLEDMIEALKKERQQRREQNQNGQSGQGQQQGQNNMANLLPQVKLLRQMQVRVNEQTKWLDQALQESTGEEQRRRLKERGADLADREDTISKLTRALAEEAKQ